MSISTREYYHGVVVAIRGRYLGSRDGNRLHEVLDELRQRGKTKVVLDLSNTEFMDSTGLGSLISAREAMRSAGGDVRLAGLEKRIKNLFLMTHLLGPVFFDFATREEALNSFYRNAVARSN